MLNAAHLLGFSNFTAASAVQTTCIARKCVCVDNEGVKAVCDYSVGLKVDTVHLICPLSV